MLDLPDNLDDRANSILETLAESGDPDLADSSQEHVDTAPAEADTGIEAANDAAADTASEVEQESPPAIAPPVSWDAEAKARFSKLPPDTQKYIAERESQRDKGLSEAQRKAADADKAAQALTQQQQAERQAYAERLKAFVDVAKVNPKLAEWQSRDWAKFAAENPLESQSEWFAYQQTIGSIRAAETEQRDVEQKTQRERQQAAHKTLTEKLDFWTDAGKRDAFQSEFRTYLKSNPDAVFNDAELDGFDDPRVILIGRKAMLYDKLMAEQSKIAQAKKPKPVGATLRAQNTSTEGANPRAEALAKRAAKSGRLDDQAAAILALL